MNFCVSLFFLFILSFSKTTPSLINLMVSVDVKHHVYVTFKQNKKSGKHLIGGGGTGGGGGSRNSS